MTELSRRTDIGRTTLHAILKDEPPRALEPAQMAALADVLGITVDELVALWTAEVVEVDAASGAEKRAYALRLLAEGEDVSVEVFRDAVRIAEDALRLRKRE